MHPYDPCDWYRDPSNGIMDQQGGLELVPQYDPDELPIAPSASSDIEGHHLARERY